MKRIKHVLWITGNKRVLIMLCNIKMIWHVPVYLVEQRREDEWRGRSLDWCQCCRQSKQRPNYPNGEAGLSQVGPLILTKNSVQLAHGFSFFTAVLWIDTENPSVYWLLLSTWFSGWLLLSDTNSNHNWTIYIAVYLICGVGIRVEVCQISVLMIRSTVERPKVM